MYVKPFVGIVMESTKTLTLEHDTTNDCIRG